MVIPTTIGNAQAPESYDGSHITPEIRSALAKQTPEIREGVKRVADKPTRSASR